MRILICDDTTLVRTTMEQILKALGHEVVASCESGQEAIEKYKETNPDCCLLDIAMPTMDGVTALKAIYAYDPNVKAIMCTGRDDQVTMIQALQAGAKGYLEKPVDPKILNETINKLF